MQGVFWSFHTGAQRERRTERGAARCHGQSREGGEVVDNKKDPIFCMTRELDIALNRLQWEHGDDDELVSAVEHSGSLLWFVTRMKERRASYEGKDTEGLL